jgi:hypothetical protein
LPLGTSPEEEGAVVIGCSSMGVVPSGAAEGVVDNAVDVFWIGSAINVLLGARNDPTAGNRYVFENLTTAGGRR